MASSDIEAILQDMAGYLDELRQVLLAEYEALAGKDPEALQQTAEIKTRLSVILDDLEQVRQRRLREAGLDLDRNGLLAYLGRHFTSRRDALGELWEKIELLGRECHRLNRINGLIVDKNRRHTETALGILQGKPRQTEYYSAAGNRIAPSASQSLAKA